MATINGAEVPKKILNMEQPAISFKPISNYGVDTYEQVRPPVVTRRSTKLYEDYIWSPYTINSKLTPIKNDNLIQKYISYAS